MKKSSIAKQSNKQLLLKTNNNTRLDYNSVDLNNRLKIVDNLNRPMYFHILAKIQYTS